MFAAEPLVGRACGGVVAAVGGKEYPGNFGEYIIQKQFRLKTHEAQFVHEDALLAFEAEGISDRREAAKASSKKLDKQLSGIKKSRARIWIR